MAHFADFAATHRPPSLLQQWVAALTFDSFFQPNLAGMRSASMDAPRQLIYSSDVADVVLNIQWREGASNATLFGQVLPLGDLAPEEFAVQLVTEADARNTGAAEMGTTEMREAGITMASATGEFAFAAVAPGNYQLVLTAEGVNILLPALQMQPPAL
jgi:hypothetical protein